MQQRKATVIASIKKKIIVKKELPNGYSYQFKGTDVNIGQLTTFIKTERLCCDFFDFSLTVKGAGSKSGLQPGDAVVTIGAYLLQSEYIFRNGADPMAGMDMSKMKM